MITLFSIQISRDGNTLTLSIKEVFPEDAGMYSVKATNSEGDCTTVARLHVLGQYSTNGGAVPTTTRSRRFRHSVQTTSHYVQSTQQTAPKYVVSTSEHHTGAVRTIPVQRSPSVVRRHVTTRVADHRDTVNGRHVTGQVRGGPNDSGEYVVNLEIQF